MGALQLTYLKDDQDNTLTVRRERGRYHLRRPKTRRSPRRVHRCDCHKYTTRTDEIEALVEQGIIDLDDPDNYNVTEFTICLGINTD